MSADKRSVSTDALETLGTVIDENQKRDAIHLAVIPVVAMATMKPGQHVRLENGKNAYPCKSYQGLGIVDPFLKAPVQKNERFWMVIYPRVITSLRHVWTHPELPDETGAEKPKEPSEAWLRDWCSRSEISYEDLITVAKSGSVKSTGSDDYYDGRWSMSPGDDYLLSLGRDAHGEIPPEVWDHVRNVIDREPVARPEYFSCSC